MAGQFDRIVEELYNKVALGKGYCDELLSEEGLEYFKKLIEFYEKPEIIETYQNGSSWYRVYRDGWCEQGGRANVSSNGTTINFLKPFKDTNYSLSGIEGPPDNPDYTANYYYVTLDTDYCILYVKGYGGGGTSYGAMWQACGYIF